MEEYKWYFIMVAVVMSVIMGNVAVSEWQNKNCKMEYAKSNLTAAEINEICK